MGTEIFSSSFIKIATLLNKGHVLLLPWINVIEWNRHHFLFDINKNPGVWLILNWIFNLCNNNRIKMGDATENFFVDWRWLQAIPLMIHNYIFPLFPIEHRIFITGGKIYKRTFFANIINSTSFDEYLPPMRKMNKGTRLLIAFRICWANIIWMKSIHFHAYWNF